MKLIGLGGTADTLHRDANETFTRMSNSTYEL
jgi:hypothetical protein